MKRIALGALGLLCGMAVLAVEIDLVRTNIVVPAGRTFQLPLAANDGAGGPVNFTVVSISNRRILTAALSPRANRSLVLNVSGVDATNAPFAGDLVLHLFENLTPVTTARIISLVQSNFYNGLEFYRVATDPHVIQGGNQTGFGEEFDDEFDPALTFTGFGQLAMANSGDDDNTSEFFITQADLSVTDSNRLSPQALDFNYTIFGQLTRGFDILERISGTAVSNEVPLTPVIIHSAAIISNRQDAVLRFNTARNVTGTVFVAVRATATNRTTATGTITVNIVSNTVNAPAFMRPLPHTLITTQIAGAVMAPFTVIDIDGDQPSLALEDTATGNFPASFDASIDDLSRLWVFPNAGFTGTVEMVLGAKDTTHSYDTHTFTVTVLPAPDTPTLHILPKTGLLHAPTNNLGSIFRVSGLCILTNQSDRSFTSNDVLKINFGGGTNTLNLMLRPDDLNLKLRRGVLSYRTPVGAIPRINLQFNSLRGTFRLDLSRFNFPQPQTNPVTLTIQLGNDYGSDVRTWTNRLGKFYPPRP